MRTGGKLNALKVARAKRGLHGDGLGLDLQVSQSNARSWIFRYSIDGRVRYLGLGSASAISLARARELVVEPRRLRAEGIDPIEHRRAQRMATKADAAKAVTFEQCAETYALAHEGAWRNAVHRAQWRRTLEVDVYPVIGALPVQAIDTPLVLKVLQPIWSTKPETANRIRGRIESVLDAAKAQEFRTGENPARWRGHLENLLAAPRKLRKIEHLAALPYREMPEFMVALRGRQGIGAIALEFTILTAARTGEVINARWSEIDFAKATWTIPGERMKAGRAHAVPLSSDAVEILRVLNEHRPGEFVFPGRGGESINRTTMIKILELMGRKDLTTHGFRSTFRDWAAEQTSYPSEVVEMALAHVVKNAVEAAYRRGDLFEKRARLMAAWSEYCAQAPTTSVVVPIRK
jgi:integrase